VYASTTSSGLFLSSDPTFPASSTNHAAPLPLMDHALSLTRRRQHMRRHHTPPQLSLTRDIATPPTPTELILPPIKHAHTSDTLAMAHHHSLPPTPFDNPM
jgi:hypothetical protein